MRPIIYGTLIALAMTAGTHPTAATTDVCSATSIGWGMVPHFTALPDREPSTGDLCFTTEWECTTVAFQVFGAMRSTAAYYGKTEVPFEPICKKIQQPQAGGKK